MLRLLRRGCHRQGVRHRPGELLLRRLKLIRLTLFWLSSAEWMAQRVYSEIRRLGASAEIHYGTVTVGAGIRTSPVTAGKPKRQTQNNQAFHCFFLRSGESPQCPTALASLK
jgi:hypothetical protein